MRKRTMHRPCVAENLRRLAAISLASGARFRYRWVPSELCPSHEASRWYDREQEVLEESRQEPRFATKRRSSQHGTSQRSGEWARATRRARTFGTSVGLGVNTGSTRSHLEQASVKATTLHLSAAPCGMDEVVPPVSTPTSLEMAMIQYFDHLFFKGSPSGIGRTVLASVCHCRPDWALCLRSDVGRIKKALKGWERLAPGNSKDPSPWIIVLAFASELHQHGHFEMSTATLLATDAYLRPGEIGSLKGNSLVPPRREVGAPFDQWALHLFPREGGLASKTQQHDDNFFGFVKPPVVGTAGQPDCPDSKEGRKAVLLHHRCVAQGTAGCGSEAAGGILRHHAVCDAPFRAEQRQGVTLQDTRTSPEAGQVARLNVSSPLRKVSTSLTVGGRSSGAGPCQDSGARSKSTCEPDASNPQRARPEACTAQTFTKRCCGSPHFQALKGRTAVVLNGRRSSICQSAPASWPRGALLSSGNSANAAGQ